MKFRKQNREQRNRWKRMQKTKRNAMPEMDRERFERVCEHPARSRHGAEGLSCPICAAHVSAQLDKQTNLGRESVREAESEKF